MVLTSGFQEVELHEGTAPIWIPIRSPDSPDHYLVAMYWAAQVVGLLGLGDINSTFLDDLLFNIAALFLAVSCRSFVMCRLLNSASLFRRG